MTKDLRSPYVVGSATYRGAACAVAALLVLATAARAQERIAGGVIHRSAGRGGPARFVVADRGSELKVQAQAGAQATAADFVREYGPLFGVNDPVTELTPPTVTTDSMGHTHSTFRQVYHGVDVFGGVLRVHQDRLGRFVAANGAFFPIPAALNSAPTLSKTQAGNRAITALAPATPIVESAALVVVDPGWYGDPPAGAHLAYHVVVSDVRAGIREAFFIDAHTGKILDRWNLLESALFRSVFDDSLGITVREEGDPAVGDFDADAAYDYSGDTYDYLFRAFGRDGIDGFGGVMSATVHLQSPSCPNAFGGTGGTFYCDGIVTDDVVAHEFTHGLTGFTAGLIYQNQPGQLNESFSDVIGETVDLLNGDAAFAGPPGGTPWPAHGTGPGTDTPNSLRTDCVAYTFMTVNSPASIAGDYPAQAASFGPPLTPAGISGDLVVADPVRGCAEDLPFANEGDMAGRIVLIRRGDCFFTVKVLNAQDAGAVAVIIYNNVEGGPAPMGGGDPAVVIPSVGITMAEGELLIATAAGETVNVTLRSDATADVRWLVSEDATGFGGFIRDMWQPSCAGDPDTANHPFQVCAASDNGGVHSGSGVPNHAFAIATDGKDFNGQTVTGVGLFKAAAVWYRALTVYLTPVSDFQDAYLAFNQSAADLIGTVVKDPRDGSDYAMFTAADAAEIDKALLAVEMNTNGRCGGGRVLVDDPAPICNNRTTLYADDFESGPGAWTSSTAGSPTTPFEWVQTSGLPSGRPGTAWFADDPDIGDCGGADEAAVHTLLSPPIVLPLVVTEPFVSFTHYLESETFFDGGNVRISVNNAPFVTIPGSAIVHNTYNGGLLGAGDNTNPIAGQSAWHGISNDGPVWGTSLIDLSGFVTGGETINLAFAFGKDCCCAPPSAGWYVDDFEVFECASAAAPPAPQPLPTGCCTADGASCHPSATCEDDNDCDSAPGFPECFFNEAANRNRFVGLIIPPPVVSNRGPGELTALRVTLTLLNHQRLCCADQDGNGFGASCDALRPCNTDEDCSGGTPLCRHELAPGDPDLSSLEGKIRYVNSFPGGSLVCADDGPPFDTSYRCAMLGCEPEYRDWASDLGVTVNPPRLSGLLYVTGDAIIPSSTIHLEHIAGSCGATPGANTCPAASASLAVTTARWGDITKAGFGPPDGKANVLDFPAVTNKLKGVPLFFGEYRVWLKQRDPAANTDAITVLDLSDAQDGVLAKPYPASRTIDACSHD